MEHNAVCFSGYMGVWALKPDWLRGALSLVRAGDQRAWPMRATSEPSYHVRFTHSEECFRHVERVVPIDASAFGEPQAPAKPPPYLVRDGVAVLALEGPMMKSWPKFGGTSTVAIRKSLRLAMADESVSAILLHVDSPGGHVAGTKELADDVRAANARKPVHAFIEDMGASAAYWVASQGERVTANALAEVGSIGVYGVLHDESKAAELAGVKVHVVSSGPMKGAGEPGTPVTDAMLADYQKMVDAISAEFFSAVKRGRSFSQSKLDAVTGGGTWVAGEAASLGLLDGIGSGEDALLMAAKAGKEASRRRAAADRARRTA